MNRLAILALALVAAAGARGAFEPPSAEERTAALGNLDDAPAVLRRLLTPDDDFAPIPRPEPGEWLAVHREKGQTFDEFRRSPGHRPDATRRVIYLQPLGEFAADSSPPLGEIQAYAAAFFQMEVKVLPVFLPDEAQFEPRQNPHSSRRQVRSTRVMDFLATRLPADAYCLLGLTMEDLYPAPSWNYVFGQASLAERVGVYSFARYDPAFFGETRPKDYGDLILRRSCSVLTHEIGHTFGLPHCIYFSCLLNGCNSLEEADATPQHLCPVCLRKLQHSIGFDAVIRYEELASFYRRHHWSAEANWVYRQLAKVESGSAPPAVKSAP